MDRRSRGDRADKMNSRTATCRSANIARIHRSSMNISRFRRLPRFRFVSLFSENGLSGLGHRRIPFALLSFSLMELSLASCNACERLLFQWMEIREIAKLEDVIDLFGINYSERKKITREIKNLEMKIKRYKTGRTQCPYIINIISGRK